MSEITLAGNTYQTGKLSPLLQIHIGRRIAPLIAAFGLTMEQVRTAGTDDLGAIISPLAGELSKMPEADVDYVLFACMNVCRRQQGDKWAAVMASNNRMLFEDIDMMTMIRLAVEVVKENMGGFFDLVPGLKS